MLKKRAISAKRRKGLGMKSPSRFGRQPNVPRKCNEKARIAAEPKATIAILSTMLKAGSNGEQDAENADNCLISVAAAFLDML